MKRPADSRRRLQRDRNHRVVLTERDRSLLMDLFLLKAARREHLQGLHFNSVARCNQRLRSLFDGGYIDRYSSPYGETGPIVYSLGRAGREVALECAGSLGVQVSDADFRRQCKKAKSGLIQHTLAVAEVYVAVKRSLGPSSPLRLVRYLPEPMVRQEFDIRLTDTGAGEASAWRQVTVAPDGCFIIEGLGGRASLAVLLEADLGDTGLQIESKLHGYGHFINGGLARQALGTACVTVAFVTTGPARADNLCRLAAKAGFGKGIFCTFDEVARLSGEAAVWRRPREDGMVSLLDIVRGKGD